MSRAASSHGQRLGQVHGGQAGLDPGQQGAAPVRRLLRHEDPVSRQGGHHPVGHRQAQLVLYPGQVAGLAAQGQEQLGAGFFQAHQQRSDQGGLPAQALPDGLPDPDPGRFQFAPTVPGHALQGAHQVGKVAIQDVDFGAPLAQVEVPGSRELGFQVLHQAQDHLIEGQNLLKPAPDFFQGGRGRSGLLFSPEEVEQAHKFLVSSFEFSAASRSLATSWIEFTPIAPDR